MYDIIIQNGSIVDGTGKTAYLSDIAIKDGKIAKIASTIGERATQTIDASGCFITPGFIDPHSHADLSLLAFPKNEAYTLQGVTTQICGNCGLSAGPIGEKYWEFLCWEYDCLNETCKSIFLPYSWQSDVNAMKQAMKKYHHLDIDWISLGEFMEKAERTGFSCNYYPMSGHNHIRNAVMGKNHRPATNEELEQMKAILRDDMEHGSNGFSTGLDYIPGRFATFNEILELAKVAKEYNGIYATHVRGFDPSTMEDNALYGVKEAIQICRELEIPTNLSHMHILSGIEENGKTEKELALASLKELERGWKEERLPIMFDVISNADGGGSTIPYLINFLRPWIVLCGSIDAFFEKLEYDDFITMIQEQIDQKKAMMLSIPNIENNIYVIENQKHSYHQKLSSIMKEKNKNLLMTILSIVKEDPFTTIKFLCEGGEDAVSILLNSERAMPSSDGFAFDLSTVLDLAAPLNRMPHPNNYQYAIRYLTLYGPERFEDKIHKMTEQVATFFQIKNRGVLKEHYWADIVILNKDNLRANTDSIHGGKAPDGIEYVIINGKIAAKQKKHTGILAGKVLRRNDE